MTQIALDPTAVIADLDELAGQSGGRFAGARRAPRARPSPTPAAATVSRFPAGGRTVAWALTNPDALREGAAR